MKALTFWKTVTVDRANLLERLVAMLRENGVSYCLIGGQAVNAYAEPVVSLDLDLVVATEDTARVESLLRTEFDVELFAHSLNVSLADSDLRVQFQTDSRYGPFPQRASLRRVLGLELPVADIRDLLQGKIWAVLDPDRRSSKRQKDLADIARLLEVRPDLRERVPTEVVERLF